MRILIQRVSRAKVTVSGETTGEIGAGLLVFLGIGNGDDEMTCRLMAEKLLKLRIFDKEAGKMDRDVTLASGSVLVVSQFTLYADTRKGNRPSFTDAAGGEEAKRLYDYLVAYLRSLIGTDKVAEGRFGAMMEVEICNDGPVTIWLDSELK